MNKSKVRVKKQPSVFLAVLPIAIMILLLGIGYGVFDLNVQVLMLVAATFGGLIALYLGYTFDEIQDSIVSKLSKTMPAIFILIIVGFLIGTWMIGGTIPVMIYYGLKLISPNFLLVTSFIVTAIISLCTGTSWGALGTVGIAIMGVAAGMGAPLAPVAGAVVGGAYFGDKLSPLSDTSNLASMVAGTNLFAHIKHTLWTTLPMFVVSCIVYVVTGFAFDINGGVTPDSMVNLLGSIDTVFNMSSISVVFTLIPIAVVLIGSALQKPTVPVMLISSALAIFNAVVFQNFSIQSAFEAAISGFKLDMVANVDPATLGYEISRLVERGGMSSMMETVLIAFCAYAFAGTLSLTGSLNIVLEALTKKVRTNGGLITSTLVACLLTVFVTSNGQLSILLPGEMFRSAFIKRGLKPKNLSRTLEDGATLTEPIVPWTAAGVYCASTTGVATLAYLPWAIVNYGCAFVAVFLGYTGLGISKINKDDPEYAEYLELNKKAEAVKA